MRIVIVGGGLAGTWLTIAAQREGHHVTLVADGEPSADIAALAMLRPSYLSPLERPLLAQSIAQWELVGQVVAGARVTRWDNDSVKQQADWFAIKPQLPVFQPDELLRRHAQPVGSPTGVWDGRDFVEGDRVIWCDGHDETDSGTSTFGCTWVNDDREALEEPFRIHHVAPYKALAAVRYEDHCRLGSSSSKNMDTALKQADKFLETAISVGLIESAHGWRRVDGVRLKREPYLTETPDGWRWAGFHRNGFGTVPALASSVIEQVTR